MQIKPDQKLFLSLNKITPRVPVVGEIKCENLDPALLYQKLYKLSMSIHKCINSNINRSIIMSIHNKVREFIKKERVITSSELAKHLKVSWNTAEKYLLELAVEGHVEKIKKEGVNLWILK